MNAEAPTLKVARLLAAHPGHCTISEFARALGCTRNGARRHAKHISHITVEGMHLYDRHECMQFAAKFRKRGVTALSVRGADLDSLRRICTYYYRTRYDAADPADLALAKRISEVR